MPAKNYTVAGLGELLWDVFPEGKQLGGSAGEFRIHDEFVG